MSDAREFDAVVVGAGFSGLLMLHRLRSIGLSVRVFEAGDGVGGTWFWNRYPGARCDVESLDYSYQFSEALQQEWCWSERYATQPELLRYLEHVADRFDLRRDIALSTRVTAARFDESTARWTVETDGGDQASARWLVMATGSLSKPNQPPFPGAERFAGRIHHTAAWPHEGVDFTGLRVGVIGTGSSGVQAIPIIAAQAGHLTVFQRTANYCVPAHNGPLDPAIAARVKADYPAFRAVSNAQKGGAQFHSRDQKSGAATSEERAAVYEDRWALGGLHFQSGFADVMVDSQANAIAAEFVRAKIRATVHDPAVAALLEPTYALGCKRLCVDSGYYAAFNRDNVTLVDIRTAPIATFTEAGLQTSAAEYPLDAIVFATGFDALTGAIGAIDIRGCDGASLRDAWAAGPRTYLGLMTAGFPNLFLVAGPGSPSVLTNVVASIEQHAEWIARCIAAAEEAGIARVEASAAAQDAWVERVNAIAAGTLFPSCNSWYLGANVPGKTRVFMPYAGGLPAYRAICDAVAADGYAGFVRSARIEAA